MGVGQVTRAPTCLLLMPKRICRRGWAMAIMNYLVVDWCGIWLLSTALGSVPYRALAP